MRIFFLLVGKIKAKKTVLTQSFDRKLWVAIRTKKPKTFWEFARFLSAVCHLKQMKWEISTDRNFFLEAQNNQYMCLTLRHLYLGWTLKNWDNENTRDLIHLSICRLLRGLAIFDGLFLLAAILSFGLPTLSTWFNDVVFMRIMATLFGLLHTFRTGSVYITLGVTFERFYSIVCPLRHNRYVY